MAAEDDYLEALTGPPPPRAETPPLPEGVCRICEGRGEYLTTRDAHRSAGWVPCRCGAGRGR